MVVQQNTSQLVAELVTAVNNGHEGCLFFLLLINSSASCSC